MSGAAAPSAAAPGAASSGAAAASAPGGAQLPPRHPGGAAGGITRASQLAIGRSQKSPGPIYRPSYALISAVPAEPRVRFGSAPRFGKSGSADAGPGPGAYAVPAPKGPAFSLRFREKFGSATFTSARDNPAPGHVSRLDTSQTRKANAPAFSLRARRVATTAADFTPAPGHTQHVEAASAPQRLSTKRNLPSVKFSLAGRARDAPAHSTGDIGPGEYDTRKGEFLLEGNRRVPAYSLKFRHAAKPAEGAQANFWQSGAYQVSGPRWSLKSRTAFGDPYAA